MTRTPAQSKKLEENARVIVTEWRLAPGARLAETANGNVETELRFGQAYARPVGVEHNIVNSGTEEFVFVEIEIK
jgi:mannose-6-phosphate isomerase-like protein (cupin superfamily)